LIVTIVLVLVGIAGYLGYWAAMGRYAVVDPGVLYRSAQYAPWRLVEESRRLGIRTVVDFRDPSPDTDAEARALAEIGVRYAHLATGQVPPIEIVDAFLEIMSDEANHPVLIHCEHGVGRTGVHAAIYRMEFQGWSKKCARFEAMLLAGFDSFQKDTDKARFLESYTPRLRKEREPDSDQSP
jgi:protein tyrosine/serine phosphatase